MSTAEQTAVDNVVAENTENVDTAMCPADTPDDWDSFLDNMDDGVQELVNEVVGGGEGCSPTVCVDIIWLASLSPM